MTGHLKSRRPAAPVPSPLFQLPMFLAGQEILQGSGQAIITSVAPDELCSLWVMLRTLRHVEREAGQEHLPVELWYLGEPERVAWFHAALQPLGVTLIDAVATGFQPTAAKPKHEQDRSGTLGTYHANAVNGYAVKVWAMRHTKAEQAIWADADLVWVRPPQDLLAAAEFEQTGCLAWPDVPTRRLSPAACQAFGVLPRDEREWETGCLVLDRPRCSLPLHAAWFYNLHREYFYRFGWGDKITLMAGFWYTLARYFLARDFAWGGGKDRDRTGGNGVFVHHAPDGGPAFHHRSCANKYRVGAENAASGYPLHELALAAVDEFETLQQRGEGKPFANLARLVDSITPVGFMPAGPIGRPESSTWPVPRRQIRVAAYDRPHYLREVADALLACEDLAKFKVVCSIDMRPDGTHNFEVVAICRELSEDVRLRTRLDCNGHTHTNLQELSEEAEYGFLVEDDIKLSPGALRWAIDHEQDLDRRVDSLCLIGPQQFERGEQLLSLADLPADARDRDEVEPKFCAWGTYFGPRGLSKALRAWRAEWDSPNAKMSWDCYLTDGGWRSLVPLVPRSLNIGTIGKHCRSAEDYTAAKRDFWIEDLERGPQPMLRCFILHGPDRKEYLVKQLIAHCRGTFDSICVLDKTNRLAAWCAAQGVDRIYIGTPEDHASCLQIIADACQEGEYFTWWDSDEIPGPGLMKWLRDRRFAGSDHNTFASASMHHYYNERSGELEKPGDIATHNFFKTFLIRKTPGLTISSHYSHMGFVDGEVHKLEPQLFWLHLKTVSEGTLGWIAHSLAWPGGSDIGLDSPEGRSISAFRSAHGLATDLQICDFLLDPSNGDALRELAAANAASPNNVWKHLREWVDYYDQRTLAYSFAMCRAECCVHLRRSPPAAPPDHKVLVPAPPPLSITPTAAEALVTVCVGQVGRELLEVSRPYFEAYARRLGLDFVVLYWDPLERWPMAGKFAIPRVLDHYERAFYVDADFIIREGAVDLVGLAKPGVLGVVDELPDHLTTHAKHRLMEHYVAHRQAHGHPERKPLPWYFNAGLMVVPKAYKELLMPPTRPINPGHCDEQHHVNAQVLDSGREVQLLDRRANWRFNLAEAPIDALLHFGGMQGDRREAMQAAAAAAPLFTLPATNDPWEMDERHVRWMHHVLQSRRLKRVLEIGCFRGYSTRALLDALRIGVIKELCLCDLKFTAELHEAIDAAGVVDRVRYYEGRSVELLHLDCCWDCVIVDGDHRQHTVMEEARYLIAHKVPAIFAHDTNAEAAGFADCDGPPVLMAMLREAGYHVMEDHATRPGERTERGMMFATLDPELAAIASRGFPR